MSEKTIELPEAELAAAVNQIDELTEELEALHAIRANMQRHIDSLADGIQAAQAEARKWQRLHSSCRDGLEFAGILLFVSLAANVALAFITWGL